MVPFTIHATRGLLRDPGSRRKTMAISVGVALSLLVAGLTVFQSWLNPHEHPWRFVLFWLACAWVTVLAVLLALFDLLILRAQERAVQKALRAQAANRTAQTSAAKPEES
jgi:protein-S-isoprenylcysteine O-methyltransferase Ste14